MKLEQGGNVLDEQLKIPLFDIISDNIDVGIAIIDKNGIIVYYNHAMSIIEGLEQEEVIGKYILEVFPTFDSKTSTLLNTLKTGKIIRNIEQQYLNHKGKKIYALITDMPIMVNGEIVGAIEFAKDLYMVKNLYNTISSIEKRQVTNRNGLAKGTGSKPNYYTFDDFKTSDQNLQSIIDKTRMLAASDSNVLIYGETGTGKEIIAQSIHNHSIRKRKPFIAQNCAAIPETLLESILFGTVKGSFTGASDRPGLIEQADGGTLLLDELNSMPVSLQAKLLRVIQEKFVRRVGATAEKPVNVRVIATVNQNPLNLIKDKVLRDDLFYRISTIYVYIPPLRERKSDIVYLAEYFIDQYKHLANNKPVSISFEVINEFLKYTWDGNVRELKNVIESAVNSLEGQSEIRIEHLPYYLVEKISQQQEQDNHMLQQGLSLTDTIETLEKKLIIRALDRSMGNVSTAARMLKLKRQTLQNKIKKYGINHKSFT
jgi:arginine utilization regulatory protein